VKDLRIVFMGTPQFAIPSIEKIFHSKHQLIGIVTQPDRPKGRGKKLTASPVKEFALKNKIDPILQPDSLKDSNFIQTLENLKADIFVIVAFRILPEVIFTMPPKGTINLHPSLLPKYRGAAPINWAIINGEDITGVTTIFIKKEIDAGNLILQEQVPIQPDETAGSLHDRLAAIGANLLIESLDKIERGSIETLKQDEKLVTKAPKLTKEIRHLNFDQPAEQVKNWIHGLSPYPGGYAYFKNKTIKFYRAVVISSEKQAKLPGTIINVNQNNLWISCNPGILSILELQLEGHKRLGIEEFQRGFSFNLDEKIK
jgi:methionyl-tRNA formyltransferase